MGAQDELDVLDAHALSPQAGLERGQRLVVAWTGVDQRERVAPQQPGVDRADVRQGERDLDDGFHGFKSRIDFKYGTVDQPAQEINEVLHLSDDVCAGPLAFRRVMPI